MRAISSDDYIIKSNRESRKGRYDIALIPHDKNKYRIIIEIKSIKNQQENESYADFVKRINTKVNEASDQIERKNITKN